MKRLIITVLILAACAARAQNVSEFTTDVLALSASTRPLSVYAEYPVSIRVTAMRGANPVNLTNAVVRWTIYDRRNRMIWRDTQAAIESTTGGVSLATANLIGLEPGAYYEGALTAYDSSTGAKLTDLALNHINLTNWCADCGGTGASLNITVISSNQNIAELHSGGLSSGLVAVTDADGGVSMLPYASQQAGHTSGAVRILGGTNIDVYAVNDGTTTTYSVNWNVVGGLAPTNFSGWNRTVYSFSGTNESVIVTNTLIQWFAKLWGAGGGGTWPGRGGGGGMFLTLAGTATNGTVFTIQVGQGGQTNGTNAVVRPYPDGGIATGGLWSANGGGSTRLLVNGSYVGIAAAGGSSPGLGSPGVAGAAGLTGASGNGTSPGTGGTPSTPGLANGLDFQGGDGNKSAGGGGLKGGGSATSTNGSSGGGAGSADPSYLVSVIPVTASISANSIPGGTTDSDYISGIGVGSGSSGLTSGPGGNGILIFYYMVVTP